MTTNAKTGNAMLLQIAETADSDTFVTIGALRATSITLNKAAVDITTKDANGWSEAMAGGGVKSVSISAGGVYINDASQVDITNALLSSTTNWKFNLIHSAENAWTGYFNVDSYALTGDVNDAQTFEISLSSSDVTTYAPFVPVVPEGGAGGAPDPAVPGADLSGLTTLTLAEINVLMLAAGAGGEMDTATFNMLSASDQAVYDMSYEDAGTPVYLTGYVVYTDSFASGAMEITFA
tara:strand:- start:404 stop:1111 length:708 start_codon:yes stop_codon:yes gene_type:complete